MKKQTLLLLITSFILLCATACSDKESKIAAIVDYPSLTAEGCIWTGLQENKVYVINSIEELDKIVLCPQIGGGTPPAVDFETRTLIVIQGTTNYGIEKVDKILHKESNTSYKLEVSVKNTGATIISTWTVAIVTHKIDAKATVVAEIKTK